MKKPIKQDATYELRHALNSLNQRYMLAMQLKAMREAKGWSQAELAKRAKLAETDISKIENPLGDDFELEQLIEIAKACDVGLLVRFAPFSFTPSTLSPASFTTEEKVGA